MSNCIECKGSIAFDKCTCGRNMSEHKKHNVIAEQAAEIARLKAEYAQLKEHSDEGWSHAQYHSDAGKSIREAAQAVVARHRRKIIIGDLSSYEMESEELENLAKALEDS
jgi:hypothetical protein